MSKLKRIKWGRGLIRKLFNRRNALLSSGLTLLILGAAVWVVNFSYLSPKTAQADNTTGTCSGSGCFSEEWTAQEVFGTYYFGWGATNDNITDSTFWIKTALPRMEVVAGKFQSNVGIPNQGTTYGINAADGRYRLDSVAGGWVTKWIVDGHIHQ